MRVVASFDPSVTSIIPSGPKAGSVGGTFDLKQAGSMKFKVKNDSNISIHLFFPNGTDSIVVAGEEMLFCTSLPTSIVTWTQDATLNVTGLPLVSKVYITVYDQTDREQGTYPFHITRLANLGNTVPIATSANVSTLSNEGNASQTLVIDIGQTGRTLLITINSDGSTSWSVLQSGVVHNVFAINNLGTPLQIGQTGDFAEFLGKLFVDQNTSLDNGTINTDGLGNITLNNTKLIKWKDSGGTARNILTVDASNNVILQYINAGGTVYIKDVNSNSVAHFGNSGISLDFGTLSYLVGSISRCNGGVPAAGSGTTISHGLGATPSFLNATPVGNQPFSATVGIGNSGSTTFQVTIGAGSQVDWFGVVT